MRTPSTAVTASTTTTTEPTINTNVILERVSEEGQHPSPVDDADPRHDRGGRDRLVEGGGVVARLERPDLVEYREIQQVGAGNHQADDFPQERRVRGVLLRRGDEKQHAGNQVDPEPEHAPGEHPVERRVG